MNGLHPASELDVNARHSNPFSSSGMRAQHSPGFYPGAPTWPVIANHPLNLKLINAVTDFDAFISAATAAI
jgi:hypothetical protein